MKPHVPLSASRIKTLKECSWIYYCKYILGVPEKGNSGSSMGWICHLIFECLGSPRAKRRVYYGYIVRDNSPLQIPAIRRLVLKHAKRLGVDGEEFLVQINKMITTGVLYDFYGREERGGKEPCESHSELEFDITKDEENAKYRIRGFIDKLFLFKKESLAVNRDFKSSKKMFEGEEKTFNLQDYMYCLAVKALYPDFLKRRAEFLFLQHENMVMEELDDSALSGFEHYLTKIQEIIDNFSEEHAESNMAFDQGWPSDGTFSGKLKCGMGKQKGELKKDGNPKWACPFKWGFSWYRIENDKGELLSSCFEDDLEKNKKLFPDGIFRKQKYAGCPKWA